MSAAMPSTMRIGRSPARPAGFMPMCCLISGGWNIRIVARHPGAAQSVCFLNWPTEWSGLGPLAAATLSHALRFPTAVSAMPSRSVRTGCITHAGSMTEVAVHRTPLPSRQAASRLTRRWSEEETAPRCIFLAGSGVIIFKVTVRCRCKLRTTHRGFVEHFYLAFNAKIRLGLAGSFDQYLDSELVSGSSRGLEQHPFMAATEVRTPMKLWIKYNKNIT